jgi:hypothetical protein
MIVDFDDLGSHALIRSSVDNQPGSQPEAYSERQKRLSCFMQLVLRTSQALPVRSVEPATTAEVLRAGLPGGTTVEHLSALLLFTGRD